MPTNKKGRRNTLLKHGLGLKEQHQFQSMLLQKQKLFARRNFQKYVIDYL